jgi:hypothetical protein
MWTSPSSSTDAVTGMTADGSRMEWLKWIQGAAAPVTRQGPNAITAYSPAMTANRQEVLRRNLTCLGTKSFGAQGKTSSDRHCCEMHSANPLVTGSRPVAQAVNPPAA